MLSLIISILMIVTLTATSMFVSYAVTVDTVFTDVSKTDWFYGDVQYVYAGGIMNGVDTDEFAPNSPLSRAMGVTILYRAAGEPGIDGAKQIPFDDVESGQWYTDAVLWAHDSGIVNGRAVNEFATNANITRAELATILLRYADHEELELPETKDGKFADEDEIPEFAKEAVNALYKAGIVNGKEGNNFDPSANVTRAETAAMIHRFIETAKKPTDTPDDPQDTPDDPQDTPDNPQDTPDDPQEKPQETPSKYPKDVFEPDAPLFRAMAVTMLYRADGEPESRRFGEKALVSSFTDVFILKWYGYEVEWALDEGIESGRSVDYFGLNDQISRVDFAVMLARYAKSARLELAEKRNGTFADENKIPDYAKEAVNALYKAEVINGKEGNIFDPTEIITQGEAAEMIKRLQENSVRLPEELAVLFRGQSYTYLGNTPLHFKRIAENRINVMFWNGYDQSYDPYAVKDEVDIFILDGVGMAPTLHDTSRYLDILGSDKSYYGFATHIGPPKDNSEMAEAVFSDFLYDVCGALYPSHKGDNNATRKALYDDLEKNREEVSEINMTIVALGGVIPYNSEFKEEDFFIDDYWKHPKEIMGYCTALAMYCTIFDVKATDQNNGALSYGDIPGDTQEEKDAYMVEVKKTVQHILDIQ